MYLYICIYIYIHIHDSGAAHTRVTSIFSGNGDSRLRERPMRGAGSVSRGEEGSFVFWNTRVRARVQQMTSLQLNVHT